MSLINTQIEDLLHAEGYKTERNGGIVNVFDPVHRSAAGSTELLLDHFELVEIRSMQSARSFIEVRGSGEEFSGETSSVSTSKNGKPRFSG